MPKKALETQFSDILQIVKGFPTGASLTEISQCLNGRISQRTLLRRVIKLVADGSLLKRGTKRNARYFYVEPKKAEATSQLQVKGEIVLSNSAKEILTIVQQPIITRHSVGYNRDFVDRYRPNATYYLSEYERQHLWEVGNSKGHGAAPGTYARAMLNRLLIDLSWNSSRLEGNTYSLLETEQLIQLGKQAEGKSNFETRMVLNHKAAIEFLVDAADEIGFNRYTILNLHAFLSDGLLGDPSACGRLRTIPVGISGTVYRPADIPQIIEEYFQKILNTTSAIHDPFEQAFYAMVQLPYLQPFEDVNKRVSRLAANISFIKANLCPLSFIDVPNEIYTKSLIGVYELNQTELLRDLFIWAYEHSAARYASLRQVLGEPDPFKLKYRSEIMEIVSRIVKDKMDKQTAIRFIKNWSDEHIANNDRGKFIIVVETELLSLHEGNIARYRLRPSEFASWKNYFK